jgi:hypothetical protein
MNVPGLDCCGCRLLEREEGRGDPPADNFNVDSSVRLLETCLEVCAVFAASSESPEPLPRTR